MKVLFGNRGNAAFGGDTMKMNRFAEALRTLEVQVNVIEPTTKIANQPDIIHAFNLNWTWTTIFRTYAEEHSIPLVVSTIHFDIAHTPIEEQRKTVDYASALVLFSQKERLAIERYLNISIPDSKICILPNGVSDKISPEQRDRDIDFLTVCNYVHPRKRITYMTHCLPEFTKVVVGKSDTNGASYFQACKAGSMNTVFIADRLTHEELSTWYSRAKVVCAIGNPDPFPNPVLEGAKCGAHVLCNSSTYVDWVEPWLSYVDDQDITTGRLDLHMRQVLKKTRADTTLPTYLQQATKLLAIYKEILE